LPASEILKDQGTLRYTSAFVDKTGAPALRMWSVGDGAYFRLEYNDGHRFWMDKDGEQIWASWPDESNLQEVSEYLLGPVFGIVLRLRGLTCLHASCVSRNGRAIAFVGPPGAGKSTTAALLSKRGYSVMADDITVIAKKDDEFIARPAYPALWLWGDSVELVYKDAQRKPPRAGEGNKARVSSSEGMCYESRSVPLRKIYILEPQNGPTAGKATARDNFLALLANTYATNTLDIGTRVKEFAELEAISRKVPIERLCRSEALDGFHDE
jgi:hypothetical protein